MNTIREGSRTTEAAHISCQSYRSLQNISHFHSDYELVYILRGCAHVSVNERTYTVGENEAVFIACDDIHCIKSDESTVITVIKINKAFFEKHFTHRVLPTPFISDARYMRASLDIIVCELLSCAYNHGLMAESAAISLLIQMLRREGGVLDEGHLLRKSNSHVLYYEISRKISEEYSTITFEGMAKYMHFSKPYFSKVFHDIFGMTFTQYVHTVRIAAAIERIKEHRRSITEIALLCGFNTIRSFNRLFRQMTGYSPNSLPADYVFMYSLQNGCGLDPTLNCTVPLDPSLLHRAKASES